MNWTFLHPANVSGEKRASQAYDEGSIPFTRSKPIALKNLEIFGQTALRRSPRTLSVTLFVTVVDEHADDQEAWNQVAGPSPAQRLTCIFTDLRDQNGGHSLG
jgi:hypothetical protein